MAQRDAKGRRLCGAKTKAGGTCRQPAVTGAVRCRIHLGGPQARANAEVRATVDRWTIGDATDDPAQTLLRLITQSRRRADTYAERLAYIVDENGGDLAAALVGETMIVSDTGSLLKVGEYVRGLVQLEERERDRLGKFCEVAIKAGLAERLVRVAEREQQLAEQALLLALADHGLDEAAQLRIAATMAGHLRALEAAVPA